MYSSLVYNTYISGGEAWVLRESERHAIDSFHQSHGRVLLQGAATYQIYNEDAQLVKCHTAINADGIRCLKLPTIDSVLRERLLK